MKLSFRLFALMAIVGGIALGVTFGVGVYYGRESKETVQTGLTTQQLQSLLGIRVSEQPTSGTPAGSTAGQITAIEGQTVTIKTSSGSVKLNLSDATTISKLTPGAATDLAAGSSIFVTGAKRDDGSFDATAIAQVPAELLRSLAAVAQTAGTR